MSQVLVLGDSNGRVIGTIHRPDEQYAEEIRDALDEGAAQTAVVELETIRDIPPEDAIVRNGKVERRRLAPGEQPVSVQRALRAAQLQELDAKLGDAGLSSDDWLATLRELETLRRTPLP